MQITLRLKIKSKYFAIFHTETHTTALLIFFISNKYRCQAYSVCPYCKKSNFMVDYICEETERFYCSKACWDNHLNLANLKKIKKKCSHMKEKTNAKKLLTKKI